MIGTAADQRSELLAMEMFQKAHVMKLELLSSSVTIDSTLEFIRSNNNNNTRESGTQKRANQEENDTAEGKQSVF